MSWLIFPKKVLIKRIDTAATAAASGYNDRTREAKHVNANDGSPRTTEQRYMTPVLLSAQIETIASDRLNGQRQTPHGNVPDASRTLIFDTGELVTQGLIDVTTRRILLQSGDRLVSVHDYATEALIETIVDPPGLRASLVEYIGFGFGDGLANLVRMTLTDQPQGARN
jgi:hypothetical protein